MQENTTVTLTADEQIFFCLNPDAPKSFFLFAGAGSGKTRSLVTALQRFRGEFGIHFRLQHKRIAVITYTNAASDEILQRMEFDSLFSISTIHHFCWELIQPYQRDIWEWRRQELQTEIETLEGQLKTGRQGKTAEDRRNRLEQLQTRLSQLPQIKKFTYNPNGDNRTRESLNHSQVIKIATDFLHSKPLLQQILTNKYPIIFIDEAQDTKKELIEVLFAIQQQYAANFSLGLFGDTMQRIYLDGKENLGVDLPTNWIVPEKTVNYRCAQRIVRLINQLRFPVDQRNQEPLSSQPEGFARLFIAKSNEANKLEIEDKICVSMSEFTGDTEWQNSETVKKLILEHHMAAHRLGFASLYEALNSPERYRTGLADGSLSALQVFTKQALPIITAHKKDDNYEVMRLIKQYSPLIAHDVLRSSQDQLAALELIRQKVARLTALWSDDVIPTIGTVARELKETGLLALPDIINILLTRRNDIQAAEQKDGDEIAMEPEKPDDEIEAWEAALACSFAEIAQYQSYVSQTSGFATHQGVKGLEFPRVMVILDDEAARGNLFKYERLFGVESLSDRDVANQKEGKDTSVDRARRLFYVACSRAKQSLAIMAYTAEPATLSHNAIANGWFTEDEIEIIG